MAFDFPAAPAIGDKFTPADGPVYTWNGFAWSAGVDNAALAEYVLRTGDTMTGALLLPIALPTTPLEATHKDYVDKAIASQTLYQGVWQPGPNVPDLTPANVTPLLHGYSWVAATADPAIPEAPPAGIPGLSGVLIASSDSVIWNDTLSTYQIVKPPLTPAAGTIGDVKASFLTGDHNGWIKLDDRDVTTLTPSQQTAAASLGFTSKLPLAFNAVPMQNGGVMGAIAGSMTKKITQANIPAYQMTTGGTAPATNSAGEHTHSIKWTDNPSTPIEFSDFNANNGTDGIYFSSTNAGWHRTNSGNPIGGDITTTTARGAHTHTVDSHTHAVGSGGSGADFDVTPRTMAVWYFVFLGL